jgi:hypothetical protein
MSGCTRLYVSSESASPDSRTTVGLPCPVQSRLSRNSAALTSQAWATKALIVRAPRDGLVRCTGMGGEAQQR